MSGRLISIAGVDNKMENILSTRGKIKSLKSFWEATRTLAERAELAKKTRIPLATITHWAAQAELLRMDTMSYDMAYEFIEAGFYSVKQIQETSAVKIFEKIKEENPNTKITEENILKLQKVKVEPAREFDCSSPILKDKVVAQNTTPNIYSDLSNVISELGKGVAHAQHELDLNSLDIQNNILQDDRLYGMGLQATWYVMPEVEFTMKMDYSVYEERTESGNVNETKVSVLPSNATYSNLFKSTKKEESSVRLRIVPIPPNEKFVTRRYMVDLSTIATMEDLKSEFEKMGLSTYKIVPEEAMEWDNSTRIKVVAQYPLKNTLLNLGVVPEIEVKKN